MAPPRKTSSTLPAIPLFLIAVNEVGAVLVAGEHVSDSCQLCADKIPDEAQFLLASYGEKFGNLPDRTVVFRQQKVP